MKQVAASAKISFETPGEFSKAIKAVRSDINHTDWCLVGYKDDSVLRIVGSGKGGLESLLDAAEPFGVNYGLLRVSRCLRDKPWEDLEHELLFVIIPASMQVVYGRGEGSLRNLKHRHLRSGLWHHVGYSRSLECDILLHGGGRWGQSTCLMS